jgi:hypothetical protein
MKIPQKGAARLAALALAAFATAEMAFAQTGPGNNPFKQPITTAGQEASSYFELPIQRLKSAVPALRGIRYEAGQEQLQPVLDGVAAKIASVLPQLPDLISREEVVHFQSDSSERTAGGGLAALEPTSRQYKYLIRCLHNTDGSVTIEESRVNAKGELVQGESGYAALRGTGFANQWLFFSKANQPQFHFRYLGQQEKSGRKTYVVAFAQDPRKIDDPAYFESDGKKAPFYYQGVFWADQSTFDLVALRTDLLAPAPQVGLRQLTTELTFRSVPIHGYDAVFWLPSEVDISTDQGGGPAEESHRYSDYHLFHADARIVATP